MKKHLNLIEVYLSRLEPDNQFNIPIPTIAMTISLLKNQIDKSYNSGMDV